MNQTFEPLGREILCFFCLFSSSLFFLFFFLCSEWRSAHCKDEECDSTVTPCDDAPGVYILDPAARIPFFSSSLVSGWETDLTFRTLMCLFSHVIPYWSTSSRWSLSICEHCKQRSQRSSPFLQISLLRTFSHRKMSTKDNISVFWIISSIINNYLDNFYLQLIGLIFLTLCVCFYTLVNIKPTWKQTITKKTV